MTALKIAVTGARGRLGSALVAQVPGAFAWSRPDYDLDDPQAAERLLARDLPDLVIHAAAWTDVDGCALHPDLARRRNAQAVGELASACARHGAALVLLSTNEVFDGDRTDRRGYAEGDPTGPPNPYGASNLEGEHAARAALPSDALWIVRTAWLYGPAGNDFPSKILAAADRLPKDEPLRVVSDEWGSPTYAPDLAAGIIALVKNSAGGLFHLVNAGQASRYEWARVILERCRPHRRLTAITGAEFKRPSRVPKWAVLDPSRAGQQAGIAMRPWGQACEEYLASMCGSSSARAQERR